MNNEKPRFPGQIGDSKVTVLQKDYPWGIYVWIKANGKPFTDGSGNVLNIPSHKGDALQMEKLKREATYLGHGDGHAEFYPGMERISDEEYSEQVDRMKQGLIPNLNDLGAVQAAKDTIALYGDDE
jgi:hypothetical protein